MASTAPRTGPASVPSVIVIGLHWLATEDTGALFSSLSQHIDLAQLDDKWSRPTAGAARREGVMAECQGLICFASGASCAACTSISRGSSRVLELPPPRPPSFSLSLSLACRHRVSAHPPGISSLHGFLPTRHGQRPRRFLLQRRDGCVASFRRGYCDARARRLGFRSQKCRFNRYPKPPLLPRPRQLAHCQRRRGGGCADGGSGSSAAEARRCVRRARDA